MAKIGDIVRYLNSVGGGRITRIDGAMAYVDEDGFETPVLLRECVVVSGAMEAKGPSKAARESKPEPEEAPFVETAAGEALNVVLAYEANDLKRLSTSDYDAYLVNDSNYYLYVTYLTRGDEQSGWVCRWDGLVEPATQVLLGEVEREDLSQMDRVAVQYMAFKRGSTFAMKTMACVEHKLDTTKFFKLHCFQPNQYFDAPVITLPIVRNDLPVRPIEIDGAALRQSMREKGKAAPKVSKPSERQQMRADGPLVVDLHIAELIDTTAGLQAADILNLQIDKFREVMDSNLRNHGRKIVFIHGKGDGVLRKALLKDLGYRYKEHDVQDASFREYGFGATQVTIK